MKVTPHLSECEPPGCIEMKNGTIADISLPSWTRTEVGLCDPPTMTGETGQEWRSKLLAVDILSLWSFKVN